VIDDVELADGRHLVVRTTTADDADAICGLYRDLAPDDRRRRFFGSFTPRREWCREWATIGERGGFGVVAFVRGEHGEELAGEAGYAMRDDGDGDLAVTVARPWRGWLGAYLLDVLLRRAAAAGVTNLQAEVMLENGPMLSLLQHRDPVSLGHDDGVVRLSIGTGGPTASWPPADHRPRVLVEVAGRRWSGERAADAAGLATAMCAGPGGRARHGCPVLDGGSCPLADDADAIIVLLDPDDERSQRLVEAHRSRSPGTPVLVRHTRAEAGEALHPGCVEVAADGGAAVAQVLSLIGGPAVTPR
jgi:hypothetical protein